MSDSSYLITEESDPRCNRTITVVTSRILWTDYVDLYVFPVVFLACVIGSILILIITVRRVRLDYRGEWYLTHAIICVLAVSDLLGM